MLGLEYGMVALAPYDAAWEQAYCCEEARLRAALVGVDCAIEHVGSTAVPGLPAKPIIDIAIGLHPGSSIQAVIVALEGIDLLYRGDAGDAGGHLFVRESAALVRTHHIHVVFTSDPQWDRYLWFRDVLREDREIRNAYAAEKRRLAEQYPMDRTSYTKRKELIIKKLLAAARPTSG